MEREGFAEFQTLNPRCQFLCLDGPRGLVTSGRMSQGGAAEHSTVHPTLTCPTDMLRLLSMAATDLCGTQEEAMQTEPINTEKRQLWSQ